jgi:hypothetical protein
MRQRSRVRDEAFDFEHLPAERIGRSFTLHCLTVKRSRPCACLTSRARKPDGLRARRTCWSKRLSDVARADRDKAGTCILISRLIKTGDACTVLARALHLFL